MNKKHQPTLRATLLRMVAIPAVAVMVVLGALIFLSLRLIQNEIVGRQELLVRTLAQQGDQYLDETAGLMRVLAETIMTLPPEHQRRLLQKARLHTPRFSALYLLNLKGRVLVEETTERSLLNLDRSGEEFFRQVRDSGQPYFSHPFISLTTGEISITAATPILIEGEFAGALLGELNLGLVQQAIEQVNQGEENVAFIVDQRGTTLAHPDPQWVQERRYLGYIPLVQAGLAGQETFEIFYDDSQGAWFIGSVTTMKQGWIVVSTQPAVVAARPLITLALASGGAFVISLAFFFLIQGRAVQQITAPISALVKKADALAMGDYKTSFAGQGGEFAEISSLEHSFAHMVEAVRERDRFLEQRVAERTEQLEQANRELSQTLKNLQATQQQLIEAEKMAALGGLVAGVAHEINTPVGIGVTAASELERETQALVESYNTGTMKRTTLSEYLHRTTQGSRLILDNLHRAAELVQSFKQVAVDQTSLERRSFAVKAYIEDTLLSLRPKYKRTPHSITVNGDEEIVIESYPGAFSQVVANLVLNSIVHAYGEGEAGQLRFDLTRQEGGVLIEYSDDGRGIPPENLPKIFDPFFTTARGQGGSGLGLHIVYNLVTQKLKGTIQCDSQIGVGTKFRIKVPIE